MWLEFKETKRKKRRNYVDQRIKNRIAVKSQNFLDLKIKLESIIIS